MFRAKKCDLEKVTATLNGILSREQPETISSMWIKKHAPHCHRFIHKYIRTEVGRIDWDQVTYALHPEYQRLWRPQFSPHPRRRRNCREVDLILDKYRSKLYVFLAPVDETDLQIRDRIAVALVRLAQSGNLLARDHALTFVRYTADSWLDAYSSLSRWKGREIEMQERIEGCIRRYRYSGSFLRYVFRTLQCAARGIRPDSALGFD